MPLTAILSKSEFQSLVGRYHCNEIYLGNEQRQGGRFVEDQLEDDDDDEWIPNETDQQQRFLLQSLRKNNRIINAQQSKILDQTIKSQSCQQSSSTHPVTPTSKQNRESILHLSPSTKHRDQRLQQIPESLLKQKLGRNLFFESLDLPCEEIIKDLFLDMLEHVHNVKDANLRSGTLAVLQKFWEGTLRTTHQEVIQLSPSDYWILFEQSKEPAIATLVKFAADMLSVVSQEADVAFVFLMSPVIQTACSPLNHDMLIECFKVWSPQNPLILDHLDLVWFVSRL
ncbi:MAG: hypothetical protein EZS28_010731 [Streblomastix strix]|uniref:Uncharacterized protein n=1 Tax=Streblomastix strix TaxID=222440 RepID=A0A5J4WFS8_9EUKA|nr:MAG: hypothetical protein EZS28_010731 [Streblomastix strix]